MTNPDEKKKSGKLQKFVAMHLKSKNFVEIRRLWVVVLLSNAALSCSNLALETRLR